MAGRSCTTRAAAGDGSCPSPQPLEVVELDALRSLLDGGTIAIACGGRGIPVARRDGRLAGVDAVIDKDRASSVLARALGAERLVILTEVPAVYRDFGEGSQEELRELSDGEATGLARELEAGSMRPKLEAAADFARETGHEVLVTSPAALADARRAGPAGPPNLLARNFRGRPRHDAARRLKLS